MKNRIERAAVIALGCPKNRVDSECLLASLAGAGYQLTAKPETADLVVLTTCAFLNSAVNESVSLIKSLTKLKTRRPDMKLVVAGCLIQRFGFSLSADYPLVDHWVGLDQLNSIPELLGRKPVRHRTGFPPRLLSTPGNYAYLKIADGCNNRCSYCLIPEIRGRFRSRSAPEIVAEAELLAALGVKELILVAQDTTAWGMDRYGKPALARLLDRLSSIKGIRWLRLMYCHPAHLTEDVIEQFGSNRKLCRYIDLPLQHINDRILQRMNRHYTRRQVERLLDRLRRVPEMHIRTTFITGFPGETAATFAELLDFIRTTEFDRLSGYAFSPEPGTAAARMKPAVHPRCRQQRLKKLLQVQATVSRRRLRRLQGQNLKVLADFPREGRTEWDAPEVDGVARLTSGSFQPGQFYHCQVVKTTTHDLLVRIC
ncbi:MAG: 30S ribosomal protein S12 methylthiotransferase RimO [candidate division WOR-3 bacterium]